MSLNQDKKLLHNKENKQPNEKQPMEWKKTFANHKSDKGLIFKIHKEFIHLNNKIINNK